MRPLFVILVSCLSPAIAFGQAGPSPLVVDPVRPAAGSEVRVKQSCPPPNAPMVVVGDTNISLPAVGSDPDWRFMLPAALEPKAYSLRWKCGTVDPAKELPQLAVIEVSPVVPRVIGVSNPTKVKRVEAIAKQSQDEKTKRDQLKDVLEIKVANLAAWRQLRGNDSSELHLYLGGTELQTVVARLTAREADDPPEVSTLRVVLELDDKNTDNRRAWVQVLKAALDRKDRTIGLTVGPSGAPFQSSASIALDVFPWYTWLVGLSLGLVVLALIVLGKKSNLLRDSNGSATPPYSLAKHQMAVWFVVIVGSYLYVWLITGSFSSISTTALALIGISGATGLVAVTMDSGKREEAAKARLALQAERDALQATLNDPGGLKAQLAALGPGSPDGTQLLASITPKLARLGELNGLLAVPVASAASNRQWYLDLLSDESGVSFHRLQMAIWTVVLAMVFVRAVIGDILMPNFDPTLLGLLGISSGTYLGFKFPEKR